MNEEEESMKIRGGSRETKRRRKRMREKKANKKVKNNIRKKWKDE